MPKMRSDVQQLQKYVKDVCNSLAQELNITPQQSMSILKKLETEHYVTIESPQIEDTPATALFLNLSPSTLGMTSYKASNIPGKFVFNLHKEWENVMSFIPTVYPMIAEISVNNPVLFTCKVLCVFFIVSKLCKISISENGTAIIMALRKCDEYSASEQQCFQNANEILANYNYKPMDNNTFQREINILLNYQCIDEEDGKLHLRETVVGIY